MTIGGHTKLYAVLGHPIGHTLSPVMHNAALTALRLDAVYVAFDVAPDRLMRVLSAMADMGFGGVNLTVPLKEVAFAALQNLDESARLVGAVNTVQFTPAGPKGYSTDGMGFLTAMREAFGAGVEGLDIFVLGCGGAGRTVALTCAAEGASNLVLADIDARRCEKVAGEITAVAPAVRVKIAGNAAEWSRIASSARLVIQSTPVGMKSGDASLLAPAAFHSGQMVLDLVYNPAETALLRTAKAAGAEAVNGLGMLLHQGAASLSIWTGRRAPVDVMRVALETALYGASGR